MNILPREKQVQAIAALTEGCSIRSTERLTGAHRDTIMRLGVQVGEGCAQLHDSLFRNLQVPHIELDEVWAFVAKKQRREALGSYYEGPTWRRNGYIVAVTKRVDGEYTEEFQDRWAGFVKPA